MRDAVVEYFPGGLHRDLIAETPDKRRKQRRKLISGVPMRNSSVRAILSAWWLFLAIGFGLGLQADDRPSASALKLLRPPTVSRDDLPVAFRKEIPASLHDLESIEEHVKDLVAKVSPAVVAVRVANGTGSGVVISEDGYVLSAAHVCDEPDLDAVFTFPDGKTVHGKTLGTNHELDAGLLKITDEGKWPKAEVGDVTRTRLGDWVLALGHPGGFDPQRSRVVRLGRVIRLSGLLQSDCTLIGGDSGGPLFDMHGQVIGIHSRISDSTVENFHVPILAFQESWERLLNGDNWGDSRQRAQPWLGVWGLDHPDGFRVELINSNGPAERAGLKIGDVVTGINGHEIHGFDSFSKFVGRMKRGQEVTLAIKRDDLEMTMLVTVASKPQGLSRGFGP